MTSPKQLISLSSKFSENNFILHEVYSIKLKDVGYLLPFHRFFKYYEMVAKNTYLSKKLLYIHNNWHSKNHRDISKLKRLTDEI